MARRIKESQKQSASWLAPFLVVICGIVAYQNSFNGPFVFDDIGSIRDLPEFGAPPQAKIDPTKPRFVGGNPLATTLTNRPLLWLSFRLNYYLAGEDPIRHVPKQSVVGYHVTNLIIHLSAALLLYGIVRRNLIRSETWGDRFGQSAPWLACAAASIWAVHPLNTEAVTYIVQRAESLAAVFYLAVIYCLVRSDENNHWQWPAIAACVAGIITKEILATAPVVALLYDRAFLAGSFMGAIKKRRTLYIGLFSTWALLITLTILGKGRGHTVGFSLGMSWLDYARTQLDVVARYLRLVVWPGGLIFSFYDFPISRNWSDIQIPGILVAIAVPIWLASIWKFPKLSFLGSWVFLILAPSSSVVPIVTEIVAEHRMYLPLAGPVVFAVVGVWMLATRGKARWPRWVAGAAALAVLVALSRATFLRNEVYHTALALWQDNVIKRPDNPQALYNLGFSWAELALQYHPRDPERINGAAHAIEPLRRVVQLMPDASWEVAQLMAHMLIESGDMTGAEQCYTKYLPLYSNPDWKWEAHLMRGILRANRGAFDLAKADFEQSVQLKPDNDDAHYLLGADLEGLGRYDLAKQQYQTTLSLNPDHKDAKLALARLQARGY